MLNAINCNTLNIYTYGFAYVNKLGTQSIHWIRLTVCFWTDKYTINVLFHLYGPYNHNVLL